MSLSPRALILGALFATAFVPTAAAENCWDVTLTSYADGLIRLLANPMGGNLQLGLVSGVPGDGFGMFVTIWPAACTGFGVGVGENGPNGASIPPPSGLPSTPLVP